MRKVAFILIGIGVIVAGRADAEVTALTAKFRGGCIAANTTGSCTITAAAEGADFAGDSVVLRRSATPNGRYRNVSATPRALDDTGRATFRFRNAPGCYRVYTAPNGNDLPDVRSRTICEK